MSNTPSGWYPDGSDPSKLRYWDGQAWTEHTSPAGQAPTPVAAAASAPMGATALPAEGKQNWFMRHKILTAVLAILLIGIIASVASGGGDDGKNTASDDSSSSTEPTEEAAPTEEAEPTEEAAPTEEAVPTEEAAPTEEAEPTKPEGTLPMEDGDWRLDSVQLKDDGLGDFGGVARITYLGEDGSASNIFTITVLDKSGGVIASLDGSAEGMGPGGTETVQLISFDDWKPGDYKLFDFQKGF